MLHTSHTHFESNVDIPWLDRPDAEAVLEEDCRRGRYPGVVASLLRDWIRSGYCLCKQTIPCELLDRMKSDLDAIWTTRQAIPGLIIEQIALPGERPGMPHQRLIELDPALREELRTKHPWRVHAFGDYSESAAAIQSYPALMEIVRAILDREPELLNTINFIYGSGQALHQDMAVTHIFPRNYLVGAWIACEEIHADSGPLVFYPGSHRDKMFEGFPDYPRSNLRTCENAVTEAYQLYIRKLSERYEKRELLCHKGDLLLWHGMLIHGGAPIADPVRTRRSFICHYTVRDADKSEEVSGPFNW